MEASGGGRECEGERREGEVCGTGCCVPGRAWGGLHSGCAGGVWWVQCSVSSTVCSVQLLCSTVQCSLQYNVQYLHYLLMCSVQFRCSSPQDGLPALWLLCLQVDTVTPRIVPPQSLQSLPSHSPSIQLPPHLSTSTSTSSPLLLLPSFPPQARFRGSRLPMRQ